MVPKGDLDILLIAPCTGNTLAKLANGIWTLRSYGCKSTSETAGRW